MQIITLKILLLSRVQRIKEFFDCHYFQNFEALQQYTEKSNQKIWLTGYCFDDLGTEQQMKHFGNDCKVMAEILIGRYEQFIENNSVTHITTNLSASELENAYGNRVRSRLRQMFNLIAFDKEARHKR